MMGIVRVLQLQVIFIKKKKKKPASQFLYVRDGSMALKARGFQTRVNL